MDITLSPYAARVADSVRNSASACGRLVLRHTMMPLIIVGEGGQGRHCTDQGWAGCSAQEVVNAVGLELRDLFPATTTF